MTVDFIANWMDVNVQPHPFPDDVNAAISELAQQCLAAAAACGISAEDIERETGFNAPNLIAATFLARWNPASGHGGSA
jgi:hypothetical protein